MACQLQHILNPLDEQDMSAVKILHDMTNATHTTTAPSDTTMALTPAVDGHDNSQATEVDANVHIAATILMRLSNTPQARLQPIYVIPGTDLESEAHPEESERRVNARISDGSLMPIIASETSAIFELAKGRVVEDRGSVVESERVSERERERERENEEVDDDATIDNEEAVKAREEELKVHHGSLAVASSAPSSPSPSSSSPSPSPSITAIPTIIITPPTSTTPPTPTPAPLALSAIGKRTAKRTPIDRPTIDTPNVRKRKSKPTPTEEHGHDTHTSAEPSASGMSNKRRKVAAPLPTPTSLSPYAPTAPITPVKQFAAGDGAVVGERDRGKGGRGLDGGYWDLPAVAVGEGRERGGEVKVEGASDGARRSRRVTRKSVRFAL